VKAFVRAVLALLGAAAALPAAAGSTEMRGLWVVRTALVSPQSVDRVVDQACEAGFNALFVQVRGRGDAFYASRTTPRSTLLAGQPPSFDPLARLIERARGRGLQIHAWVNILLSAHFGQPLPSGHVLLQHPDWAMVPRSVAREGLSVDPKGMLWLVGRATRGDGDVEGYYLSPSAPGVSEYLEGVVREVVRSYPVDGLHLDFIRYPSPEYDYSRWTLEGFRRSQGVAVEPVTLAASRGSAYDAYRREALTQLAGGLVRAARFERPGLVISAAVVPEEAEAVNHKYQDWPAWVSRGILDALCPMAYTTEDRIFRAQVERARDLAGPARPVWAGIGAWRLPLPGTLGKIRVARESGAAGFVLFSHESFADADWKRLRQGFPASGAMAEAAGGAAPRTAPK
jgi:uncharacterized lipoprotein YddW (UPF0748 family)